MHQTRCASPAEGFVYVLRSGDCYKIGWAKTNPRKRLSLLQAGNPVTITLVGVIEGTRATEREWHLCFKDKRVRGEWFALDDLDVARVLHESYGLDYIPDYEPQDGPLVFDDDPAPDWIPPDDEPA